MIHLITNYYSFSTMNNLHTFKKCGSSSFFHRQEEPLGASETSNALLSVFDKTQKMKSFSRTLFFSDEAIFNLIGIVNYYNIRTCCITKLLN